MQLSPLNKVIPSFGAPTLEGFDTDNIQDGQRIRGTGRQYVRFYNKKYIQPYATKVKVNPATGATQVLEMGTREVEREFVEIVTPGDKNTVDDFAEDFHKREHWKHYKAFRDGRSAPIGTPIEQCSFINQSIATELLYLGVHTQEQMADASDELCNRVANGWELREFCRAVVKADMDNKSLGQVNALKLEMTKMQELATKQAEMIDELKKQIGNTQPTIIERIVEVPAAPKNKGGRPKKTQETTVE